jgi:hypothetical protein
VIELAATRALKTVSVGPTVALVVLCVVSATWTLMLWTGRGPASWYRGNPHKAMENQVEGGAPLQIRLSRPALAITAIWFSWAIVIVGDDVGHGGLQGFGSYLVGLGKIASIVCLILAIAIFVSGKPDWLVPPGLRDS